MIRSFASRLLLQLFEYYDCTHPELRSRSLPEVLRFLYLAGHPSDLRVLGRRGMAVDLRELSAGEWTLRTGRVTLGFRWDGKDAHDVGVREPAVAVESGISWDGRSGWGFYVFYDAVRKFLPEPTKLEHLQADGDVEYEFCSAPEYERFGEAMGWTSAQVRQYLVDGSAFSGSPDLHRRLAGYFHTTPELWANLEQMSLVHPPTRSPQFPLSPAEIRALEFPLLTLIHKAGRLFQAPGPAGLVPINTECVMLIDGVEIGYSYLILSRGLEGNWTYNQAIRLFLAPYHGKIFDIKLPGLLLTSDGMPFNEALEVRRGGGGDFTLSNRHVGDFQLGFGNRPGPFGGLKWFRVRAPGSHREFEGRLAEAM